MAVKISAEINFPFVDPNSKATVDTDSVYWDIYFWQLFYFLSLELCKRPWVSMKLP